MKYKQNPLIKQTDKIKGTGGCEFVTSRSNELIMFYHAHANEQSATPRQTVFSKAAFALKRFRQTIFQVSDNKCFQSLLNLLTNI